MNWNKINKLTPYITFIIKDNPYNLSKGISDFTYKFILPVHLNLKSGNYTMYYTMLNKEDYLHNINNLYKDVKTFYPKIEHLFNKSGVNIQTSKILKNSLSVEYHSSLLLPLKDINYKVLIPGKNHPVNENSIHFSDIHIPLNIDNNYKKINNGVWNQI